MPTHTSLYAIKAEIHDLDAETFHFVSQRTMYGGKHIAAGDLIYLFASENEGGPGLIARGVVTAASAVPRRPDIERQTPRVTITAQRTDRVIRRMGRAELKPHQVWSDGRPETELNFKFYRQATNKVVSISPEAAAFLNTCF